MKKITLRFPDLDEQQIIQQCIDLADHYIVEEPWVSPQVVFKAVLETLKVPYASETLRVFCGFSAGGGFAGRLCGGLSGSLAALSFIYGSEKPMDKVTHQRFVGAVQSKDLSPAAKAQELLDAFPELAIYNKMVEDFKEKFGYTDCQDLIAPFSTDPVSRRRFGTCRRIVREAAGLVMQLILDLEIKKIQPPMGENIYSHLFK
ncbi:MAG: C-GCAxxG-C-C family protein [Dethiobacteria bacterium]